MENIVTRRTKTYVAFDGDADLMSYRDLQRWSQDPNHPFQLNDAHELNYSRDDSLPQSIINQLRERLDACKNFILIIGSETNKNRKGIMQYEIRYALRNRLPIFLTYKGYKSEDNYSDDLWHSKLFPMLPKVLREDWTEDKYCLICPFSLLVLRKAIMNYSNNTLPKQGYNWYWRV